MEGVMRTCQRRGWRSSIRLMLLLVGLANSGGGGRKILLLRWKQLVPVDALRKTPPSNGDYLRGTIVKAYLCKYGLLGFPVCLAFCRPVSSKSITHSLTFPPKHPSRPSKDKSPPRFARSAGPLPPEPTMANGGITGGRGGGGRGWNRSGGGHYGSGGGGGGRGGGKGPEKLPEVFSVHKGEVVKVRRRGVLEFWGGALVDSFARGSGSGSDRLQIGP